MLPQFLAPFQPTIQRYLEELTKKDKEMQQLKLDHNKLYALKTQGLLTQRYNIGKTFLNNQLSL